MLAALAGSAPRWLFVGGKGGVGKTTVAAALAIATADAGREVLVLSTDPAHSLGDALGTSLGADPSAVPGVPRLRAMELDAERERDRWLAEHRASLATLLDRGTYLERGEIEELLGLALPGVDEVAAMLHLLRLARDGGDDRRVIVDTAPTGHTLRLLDAPALAQRWLDALDLLDRRHDAVALALTGGVPDDEARRFARALRAEVDALAARLRDPNRTGMVLVATAEPVVVAETVRYARALGEPGVALHAIVVNRAAEAPRGVQEASDGATVLVLPTIEPEPNGVDRLRALAHRGTPAALPGDASSRARSRIVSGARWSPPLDRALYVVAGKGGVGKSTVASALAMQLAREREGDVLLLGLDPAGSLGDLWEVRTGTEAAPAPGVPRLWVRQLHASSEWRALRDEYEAQARRLAGEVTGEVTGADELLSLAPPGLDELMAVVELVDLTEGAPYVAVVLDTAPTGHLLRLLGTPELALRWTHATMRLLLRYREVAGLGDLAERLLRFAHGVRELQDLLRDGARRFVIAVALPEALAVSETRRLLTRLGEHGLPAEALLVNRALADHGVEPSAATRLAELASLEGAHEVVLAPTLDAGPRGAAALAAFASSWRRAMVQAVAPPAAAGAHS